MVGKMKHLKNNYTEETKHIVLERSQGCCEICGKYQTGFPPHSIKHYPHRKMGGTTKIYKPHELKFLCHDCHVKEDSRHGIKEG